MKIAFHFDKARVSTKIMTIQYKEKVGPLSIMGYLDIMVHSCLRLNADERNISVWSGQAELLKTLLVQDGGRVTVSVVASVAGQ